MNPNKLKRLFPRASKSFIERNQDKLNDTGMSGEPESLDRQEVCQTQRSKTVGEEFKLCHIDVVFFAQHGKRMDEDNRRYVIKPIQDAAINIGLASDDSNITSETTQRIHTDNSNI